MTEAKARYVQRRAYKKHSLRFFPPLSIPLASLFIRNISTISTTLPTLRFKPPKHQTACASLSARLSSSSPLHSLLSQHLSLRLHPRPRLASSSRSEATAGGRHGEFTPTSVARLLRAQLSLSMLARYDAGLGSCGEAAISKLPAPHNIADRS